MKNRYFFHSARLSFRNWTEGDLHEFTKMNADPAVMEHFPKQLTEHETSEFIHRLQQHYDKHNYTYFATEVLHTREFIGFIGLAYQEYETDFTPATDIGWRLKKSAWDKGYATEGAKRCLEFAFDELGMDRIISVCTIGNRRSEPVMRKIGMQKKCLFNHPKLKDHPGYERCVCYEMTGKLWKQNQTII